MLQVKVIINVDSVFNPTTVSLDPTSILVDSRVKPDNTNFLTEIEGQYYSYTNSTSATFASIYGDINFDLNASAAIESSTIQNYSQTAPFNIYPGTLELFASGGDIGIVNGTLTLFPSTVGNFSAYADDNFSLGTNTLTMSDASLSLIKTIDRPGLALNLITDSTERAPVPLHINDERPSYVVTNKGDITGGVYNLAEQSRFISGSNINSIRFRAQNINDRDVSQVYAGKNIVQSGVTSILAASGPADLK